MADKAEIQASQYLSFTIAGTDYGLPILVVKEILQYEELTRVPGTPASIRGVLNVRGQVVPVVDLAVKFGRSESVPTQRTCVLVVEARIADVKEKVTLGILSDAVNEVLDLRADDVEPPPAFGANVKLDFLTGMGKVGKAFVLLLDMDKVLTASEAELAAQAVALHDAQPAAAAAPAQGAARPAAS
jgi:purine-binding chemotaxis protein CheW